MNTELVTTQKSSIPQVAESVSLMQMALEKNYPLEQIEKMMELQDRFDAKEAKKAFIRAMAEFKSEPIVIVKDATNNKYGSKYMTIGNLVNSALPRMGECGLSHRWDVNQNGNLVTVTCIVTHEMGHSESTSMTAAPDKSGSKNPIQEIKSTRTYLQSATFESLMGLAATDANINDDGNGSQSVQYIDDKQKGQVFDMIAAIAEVDPSLTETNFINYMKVASVDLIPVNRFNQAMSGLKATLAGAKKAQEEAA